MNERHFYHCSNCCYTFALDGPRPRTPYGSFLVPYCDCDGGKWVAKEKRSSVGYLGKVVGNMVLRIEDRCPCDSRCTHAVGYHCDCVCGGANHGTHAVVKTIVNAQGIPKLENGKGLAERMAAVTAYRAACVEAQAVIDADPGVQMLRKRVWIKDRAEWERAYKLMTAIDGTLKLKTMAGRMKALAKIINAKVKETA